jgi:hypothetical protein
MHGEARAARGREWRYYLCRKCRIPSVPADDAEAAVIGAIKTMTLPQGAIDHARAELARRLEVPDADIVGTKRRRLETRLQKLLQLYGWGDLSEEEYRRQMGETRAALAELPDPDKLLVFDRNRRVMLTMAENVDRATPDQLTELVQLLVERVSVAGRAIDPASIEWTPPARPFFEPAVWVWRPRTDSNRRRAP